MFNARDAVLPIGFQPRACMIGSPPGRPRSLVTTASPKTRRPSSLSSISSTTTPRTFSVPILPYSTSRWRQHHALPQISSQSPLPTIPRSVRFRASKGVEIPPNDSQTSPSPSPFIPPPLTPGTIGRTIPQQLPVMTPSYTNGMPDQSIVPPLAPTWPTPSKSYIME